MKISFIGVLTKPLKFKILLNLILNFTLLFLPSILITYFMGADNPLFHIITFFAVVVSSGYMWKIFQHEVEKDDDTFPKFHLINDLFIGIKGLFFSIACLTILMMGIFIMWLVIQKFPDFDQWATIISIIWFLYWFLLFYAVAMGIFSENYNPLEGLNFSTITQVINASWLNYLIASFYMIAYLFIIGMICWACIIFLPAIKSLYFVEGFSIYTLIVYFCLYAKVFRQVQEDFESHI